MGGLTSEQVLSVLMSKKASLLVRAQNYCFIAGVQARDPGSAIGNCLMAYDILEWMSKT